MSSPLLVQALALLGAPALAVAAAAGLRLRRATAGAGEREAVLRQQIAELEVERAALQRTASCDPLTGVWNYRHLQLTLDREVERTRRADHGEEPPPLALLMLEIAGFDAIVEEHGRGRAGAILRDLAQRLGVEIRRTDTLARYGGEEFLVVLPDTGLDGAVQVAERLCWSVRRHRLLDWSAAGPEPSRPAGGNGLTAAVGIAVLPGDGGHAALLLRAADAALGRARAAGGDCWRDTGKRSCHTADRYPVEHLAALDEPDAAVRDGAHGTAGDTADEAPEITGNLSVCAGGGSYPSVSTAHTASAVTALRDGGS
ncbi:hypothetical protein GCM10009760_37410 [Kitasatospora kazusensis]|uniref:GGDEF domain-containing protein n=1 Tax=Kitasatospora kazusensis TaxID=407974 RepID=A0ABP5LJS6_9ACTN